MTGLEPRFLSFPKDVPHENLTLNGQVVSEEMLEQCEQRRRHGYTCTKSLPDKVSLQLKLI